MMFPSLSLNQAALAPPAVTAPSALRSPGRPGYSSNTTPRAFSWRISPSTSVTDQKAWLACEVPAFGVG